ncbi:MAG: hypothetical protein SGJ15_10415 [Bacteroidota bacterium]|nr:hypothetical protein [Bacteroidota bacterium]
MKTAAILFIVFASLVFTSCKKEKLCECIETRTITTSSGSVSTTDPVVKTEIKEIRGGEAKTWCQDRKEETVADSLTAVIENKCSLK